MIFAYTLDQVLRGEKWQTRRVIKPNEQLAVIGTDTCVEVPGKRVVYQVGKSYAVQPGRGKKSVARIELVGIRREAVAEISDTDAAAEGFSSRDAFLQTWRSIHGINADLRREVWVLEFKLQVIVADEFKTLYEQQHSKNRRIDHGHDLPAPVARVSGTGVYSRHHPLG